MILFYLEQDCIFYLSHLLFFPHLYLSIPRSIPTSSHQLAAAGAPSTMAMLYRSVTAQARDERQIKTTLFPLSPSHCARLNLRFFIFFLIFLFSLEPPGITWNLAVSQLDDAVSFMHIETDGPQSSLFFYFTHFKSNLSCSKMVNTKIYPGSCFAFTSVL